MIRSIPIFTTSQSASIACAKRRSSANSHNAHLPRVVAGPNHYNTSKVLESKSLERTVTVRWDKYDNNEDPMTDASYASSMAEQRSSGQRVFPRCGRLSPTILLAPPSPLTLLSPKTDPAISPHGHTVSALDLIRPNLDHARVNRDRLMFADTISTPENRHAANKDGKGHNVETSPGKAGANRVDNAPRHIDQSSKSSRGNEPEVRRRDSTGCGLVTSSSYSSLTHSPAVAFLSNFVQSTLPTTAPDEEGEQVGDYIMGRVLGYGGFSVVREAYSIDMDSSSPACAAVKVVRTKLYASDSNGQAQKQIEKEVKIWSRLSHSNIVPVHSIERLPTNTFIFCELCRGGNLLDYITKCRSSLTSTIPFEKAYTGLREDHARTIFGQVADAVWYLHEVKRIVHRDIKLENILLYEDGTWKLCDFGLAEYRDAQKEEQEDGANEDESEDDCGGSLAYCSPEQLRSRVPLKSPSSDVWSLSVVLYALLAGRLPFQDEYEPRLVQQILMGRYEALVGCSHHGQDLVKKMFCLSPESRWNIVQITASPWCKGL
ncbi:hypothetical protein BGZ59_001446 [Podila verticillata]|nr:hypothetical protein BGZ59_001446 [Podila verticillata]KFH70834.1 CAMK/CAMKL protein kinase [Podila verticillata NRRL 6337]